MYNNNHTFHPTKAFIRLNAIRNNLNIIKKKVTPAKVMGIVKANAYGHGINVISSELIKGGIDYLGVGHVAEGIQVRKSEKNIPILVLSPLFPEEILPAIQNELEITVVSFNSAAAVSKVLQTEGGIARIHIKINTGMNRLGVPYDKAVDTVKKIDALPATICRFER